MTLRKLVASWVKDSPVNGTSAAMSIGISRADGRLVRLIPRFLAPDQLLPERLRSAWSGVFLPSARRLSEFGRPRLWCDLASGTGQRL
jgi:hypothetical protein